MINAARLSYLDGLIRELFKLTIEELRYVNGKLGATNALEVPRAPEKELEIDE